MGHLILVVLALAALAGLALLLKKVGLLNPPDAPPQNLPYRKKDYLFTKAELSFYRVLLNAVGDEWSVFPKVRVLDLVWLPKGTENLMAHRNRVQSKHVDFVLCRKDTLAPALIIELNDSSHEADDRKARDGFLQDVFKAAGLPFLPVPNRRGYSPSDLAAQIARALSDRPSSPG